MGHVEDHLKRWLDAGVLPPEAAHRIRDYEASHRRKDTSERPGALEALLYLGFVVLAVGIFALFAQQWQDLESWARVAVIGVPTALLIGVGAFLRVSPEPELQRGSQAAWLVATGLFAGTLGVIFNEYDLGFAEDDDSVRLLTVAAASFGFAILLWLLSPSYPQVFAIAATGLFLGQALGNWSDDQKVAGVAVLAIGVAGFALAEAGWLTPAAPARILFALLTFIGPFEGGVGSDGPIVFELLAALAAAAIIAYGVLRGSFIAVLVGVACAFVFLIAFIFEHFEERIGAPMALIISGGLLVAGVLLLAVYRREWHGRAVLS